jgi:ATP-binding cassette, subfamily B, bacterial
MTHFPHFLQPDTLDCGPACLKIVAQYFGKRLSLNILREMTFQNREGTSLLSLSDAAEKSGFRTQGARLTLANLEGIRLPAILHWDQNHYVVLYKIKKTSKSRVYFLSDPACGLVRISEEEFGRHWATTTLQGNSAGIALLLEPTTQFFMKEDEQEPRAGFNFLIRYLKPYQKLIGWLFLGFLTGSLISLLFPFLTQAMVDKGIQQKNLRFIILVLIAQLVLMISQTAVGFIRSWIMLHVSARVSISLISDFLIKLMKLPVRFFDTKMIGDLRQRIEDNNRIQSFLTINMVNMSFGIFMFIIYSFVLAWYSWKILVVFLAGSALYVAWILLFLKKRKELDNRRFNIQSANQSNVYQLITGMQEIKLTNCEKQKRWEWEQIQVRLYEIGIRALSLHQNQQGGSVFINQSKNILIIFLAAGFVLKGQMTLGMLVAVQFIVGQLNSPIQELISFITTAQDARISLERLSEIHLKEDEEVTEQVKIHQLPLKKELVLENVTFHYEGIRSPKVLDQVSFTLPENKVTALVGPSGSGKTTLIKLLLGFYPPSEGVIRLGDSPLDQYSMEFWRRNCGVVMQDGFIFSDSIEGNIAVGEEKPDKGKFSRAVSVAHIGEFIDNLPLRYQTRIGQEGIGLSQGQKQRILIARAVYRDPSFLFLDEATNSLDAGNEKIILGNLNDFFRKRTVLIVAHRLSTVKNVDHIVVLDRGRMVESGKHRELVEKKGMYYHLIRDQLELGV